MLKLADTGFDSFDHLYKSLNAFYREQILNKAVVAVRHSEKRQFNMRSIRAYYATEWVKLVYEYRYMRLEPEPPNPLQH